MLGKSRKSRQLDIFEVPMQKYLNMEHELVQAGKAVPWADLETEFARFFSDKGRPSVPLRNIVGLCMLKSRFNVSEEKALNIWLENPYWQFFCGEVHFQKDKPFSASEFSRFKRRVGSTGMSRIQDLSSTYFDLPSDSTYTSYSDKRMVSFTDKIRRLFLSR